MTPTFNSLFIPLVRMPPATAAIGSHFGEKKVI